MRLVPILAALALAAAALPASAAGDAAAGKTKVFQCQGCHGITDWKTAFPEVYRVPKLGGQKAGYLVSAMKAYQKGERDFQTMRAMVADLSDKDMEDIAAYYAAETGDAAAGKKKSTPCQACHGPEGVSPSPDFPNLAGQYPDYIEAALRHYKAGKRKNPIMAEQVKALSDKDIRDLAAYYSSLRTLTVKY
jgi:cytochrome c553